MINLTDSARNAVRTAMAGANMPVEGLRIMVESGGCAGFKYVMGLVAEPKTDDLIIEDEGMRVFIDSASEQYLQGSTIDFVVALEGSGFTFDNPNAASKCSCGKSFG